MTNMRSKIGWIGLGQIGTQMVLRLCAADKRVTVYGRGNGLAKVNAAGAAVSGNYASLAAQSDALFLCVYNEDQVRDVLVAQGALAAMRPGSLLVVHTTASPALLAEVAALAEPRKIEVLDACFSGGPGETALGQLTIMAGGSATALERARPAIECYAAHIEHVGDIGAGQAVKLLNNLAFATNFMHAVKLLELAAAQGLACESVAAILQRSSGASYAMGLFTRADAAPQAVLGQIRHYLEKDVGSALSAATGAGLNIGDFAAVAEFYAPSGSQRS